MPEELTSRVNTAKISETKDKLSKPYVDKQKLDVALATNMISVGLDIARLGLMVVLNQPTSPVRAGDGKVFGGAEGGRREGGWRRGGGGLRPPSGVSTGSSSSRSF